MTNRVDYWSRRWKVRDIPWHLTTVNKFLYNHFKQISDIKAGPCRVLVPLCGKTVDLKWICDEGHEVVGIEEVEQPILEFFGEQQLAYTKGHKDGFGFFECKDKNIKIYQGSIFDITPSVCGTFDGVWDRGSLVALSPTDRPRYVQVIKKLLKEKHSILLNTIEYDKSLFGGPPHSINVQEVQSLYGDECKITTLEIDDTNADPSSPASAKMRWNIDVCHEIILLLELNCNVNV